MIARREHPEQPGMYVYVPLRQDEDGIWVPLGNEWVCFNNAFDAALMCADEHRRRYVAIARQARLLRALCEHPEFAFSGDGIDAEMVRENAQALSRLVFDELENATRLLSEPRPDDLIVIGSVAFQVDEEQARIEPRLDARR